MDREKLQAAVDSKWVPVYAKDYVEVKELLKDKHGERGWLGAMAQAISGSEKRSGKEYLRVRRSIERNETGQFKKTKYSSEMARVGKTLPPIGRKLPGDKITLTVKGEQKEGKLYPREREFTATFTGPDAWTFANDPSYKSFFKKLGYPNKVIELFESGDYELLVSSVA